MTDATTATANNDSNKNCYARKPTSDAARKPTADAARKDLHNNNTINFRNNKWAGMKRTSPPKQSVV